MITPEAIIRDISEALNTTDLVPDVNHNGKDYLSYRYRWNDTRPIVLIRVYKEQNYEIVAGKKCYDIDDDEIYEALKPLIIKKAKKELEEVLGEIAYMDDTLSVILRKDGIFRSCNMSVRTRDGDNYSADYNHKSGRIDLGRVPADFAPRFIGLVDRYFLPYVRQYREAR